MSVWVILSIVLMSFVVEAIELSPQKVLKLSLSSKGLNRLSLKEEGVRDIFLYPGNAADYVTLHKSGDIFISPQPKDTTFSLTLMGGKSVVQDLEVVFQDRPPNPVFLEKKSMKEAPSLEDFGSLLVDVMQRDLSGDPSLKPALFERKARDLKSLHFENIAGFKVPLGGEVITITKAEITNKGEAFYVFNRDDMDDVVALSATFEILSPHASGFIYFINKKKEK